MGYSIVLLYIGESFSTIIYIYITFPRKIYFPTQNVKSVNISN